ncbi:unnamed protein product [Schistosoma curassoni]|uniref:Rod_C domain-containing protein n=1 Tax=Schistosoma curassoni TaxID=6186 RepID=A0A183KJB9_9TREM|nr:unnamed protein product [Schistosoma curassoni]
MLTYVHRVRIADWEDTSKTTPSEFKLHPIVQAGGYQHSVAKWMAFEVNGTGFGSRSEHQLCDAAVNEEICDLIIMFIVIKEWDKIFVNQITTQSYQTGGYHDSVILTMYTAIGVAIESKHVQFEPTQSMMTSNQIILINKSFIYSWQYFTPKQILDLGFKFTSSTLRQRDGIERLYHIDTISLKTVSSDLVDDDISSSIFQTKVDWNLMNQPVSSDPISTLTISHSTRRLLIARESGLIQIYRLPDLYYEMKFSDNPDIFAIMEKTRMYIFDGLQSEPAIHTSTYLYEFKNLEVQGILLDELVKTVNIQPNEEFLLKTPIKKVRDFKQILEKDGLEKASEFINNNPHTKLRHLFIEACLEKQNLEMAELQFVHLQEYSGIQFIKRLRNIQSKNHYELVYIHSLPRTAALVLPILVVTSASDPPCSSIMLPSRKKNGNFFGTFEVIITVAAAAVNVSCSTATSGNTFGETIYSTRYPRTGNSLVMAISEACFVEGSNPFIPEAKCNIDKLFDSNQDNILLNALEVAEILVYFKKYDEAETLLLNNDRSDLAVELRKRLGDWFRVAQLTKDTGVLMKDLEQAEIWNGIGDYYYNQMLW